MHRLNIRIENVRRRRRPTTTTILVHVLSYSAVWPQTARAVDGYSRLQVVLIINARNFLSGAQRTLAGSSRQHEIQFR